MQTAHAHSGRWAIQGGRGSFHHLAAMQLGLRGEEDLIPCSDFYSLAHLVGTEDEVQGVMAIENSVAGSLLRNYELLRTFPLRIAAEIYLRIEQHLLVNPGSSLEALREVHSHPMALAQCGIFLRKHKHIKLVETEDTAMSAEALAANPKPERAVIASKLAASLFGLETCRSHIEDHRQNYTRFLLLQKGEMHGHAAKASLALLLPHQPGALQRVLEAAATVSLNLTKIQSVPLVGNPWHYRFYIDVERVDGLDEQWLLALFHAHCEEIEVLGIYAPGEIFEEN